MLYSYCVSSRTNAHLQIFLLAALNLIPIFSWANQAPQLKNIAKALKEDRLSIIILTGKDPERKPLGFAITQPAHGTARLKGTKVSYAPAANFNGSDAFQYTANDGELTTSATINLAIQSVNDAPIAMPQDKTLSSAISTAIILNASDVDGDKLSYKISTPPKKGKLVLSDNIATYTSKTAFLGADSFKFTAKDKALISKPATVKINITAAPIVCTPPQLLLNNTCQPPKAGLSITKSGTGLGNVSSYPIGLDCGATCTAAFTVGTLITLTATPDANSIFTGWGELCKGNTTICTVTLKATDTAIANFDVKPFRFGTLNDTGITSCSDSSITFSTTTSANGLKCPVIGHPGQDAQFGRDASQNDDSNGHAGLSFTKISSVGATLPANATEWSCVKDNVTGLMWEVKTNDSALHDKDWTYTWYQPDNTKNGGDMGTQTNGNTVSCSDTMANCNTDDYVAAVNSEGWCGFKDWRMPTLAELFGITELDRANPAIDTTYFPNTVSNAFWTASAFASNSKFAWVVGFNYGNNGAVFIFKDIEAHVRLVRDGQ